MFLSFASVLLMVCFVMLLQRKCLDVSAEQHIYPHEHTGSSDKWRLNKS